MRKRWMLSASANCASCRMSEARTARPLSTTWRMTLQLSGHSSGGRSAGRLWARRARKPSPARVSRHARSGWRCSTIASWIVRSTVSGIGLLEELAADLVHGAEAAGAEGGAARGQGTPRIERGLGVGPRRLALLGHLATIGRAPGAVNGRGRG